MNTGQGLWSGVIRQNKLVIAWIAMLVSVAAQTFRVGTHGVLSVTLYVIAVASVITAIGFIFSSAKQRDKEVGVEVTRRWFTPWRRKQARSK